MAETTKPSSQRLTTRPDRRARADALFAVYHQMGESRSLQRLSDLMGRLGQPVTWKTLQHYSSDYAWQARVRELDEQDRVATTDVVAAVADMNQRQAALGRNLQRVAKHSLEILKPEGLSPADIARFTREGIHAERLAMGEATSRAEIVMTVYNELLVSIEGLFVEVNTIEDAVERDRRFRIGVDSLATAHITGQAREVRHANSPADPDRTGPGPASAPPNP